MDTLLKQIAEQIRSYQEKGLSLFATSSFQTHSIPLLHIISSIDDTIPIYMLDTGYLFPQTLNYRDQIAELLNLNIINVRSQVSRHLQKDLQGRMLFTSNTDLCCQLNKIDTMQPIIKKHDVWINGVRAAQNANRKSFKEEEETPEGTLRYHPILSWTDKMIYDYRIKYNLPKHPLEDLGYMSIGCEPCTRPISAIDLREGRWAGLAKTECGLHTQLISK